MSFLTRIFKGSTRAGERELKELLSELEALDPSTVPASKKALEEKLQHFIQRHPERAKDIQRFISGKLDETRIKRQTLMHDNLEPIDLSHFAQDARKRMGWPGTGSVRELEGGSPAIKFAIEEIEKHGGKLALRDASRVIAVLDPESPEADYFRWEAKQKSDQSGE